MWALELGDARNASWQPLIEHIKHPDILQANGRLQHTAVYLWPSMDAENTEGAMVVFAGVVVLGGLVDPIKKSNGRIVNELWAFSPSTRTWAKLETQKEQPVVCILQSNSRFLGFSFLDSGIVPRSVSSVVVCVTML